VQALAVKPDDTAGWLELARALAADHKLDEALDGLARLDRAEPGRLANYQVLEEVLGPENRWDELIGCWSRLVEFSGGRSPEAHAGRSRALLRKGLDRLARADEQQACQLGLNEACRSAGAVGN
jgi:tetratricopeptide (TPR) repeat protein